MTAAKKQTTIDRVIEYLTNYIGFAEPHYVLPVALWVAMTHCWDTFDALGYLCITSLTKQSGKTALAQLIQFSCNEPHPLTAMTPAAMFHTISNSKPVIICDESEFLNSESATFMRSTLNMGYRRGSQIERIGDSGKVKTYDVYCPKVFVLIGDVYDTLRDRSIIIRMKRTPATQIPKRFTYKAASSDGHDIRAELEEVMREKAKDIEREYSRFKGLLFLPGRDEEIWTPLFVLATVLCPDRIEELTRCAVDIATEKTAEAVSFRQSKDEEQKVKNDQYKIDLLRDVLTVAPSIKVESRAATKERKTKQGSAQKQPKTVLYPDVLLEALRKLTTGPWRKYTRPTHGGNNEKEGLTRQLMADMLSEVGIKTIPWRVQDKVERVFDLAAIKAKATALGVELEKPEEKPAK